MTYQGCKYLKSPPGRQAVCTRFHVAAKERCIDFRHKQGQRVKS